MKITRRGRLTITTLVATIIVAIIAAVVSAGSADAARVRQATPSVALSGGGQAWGAYTGYHIRPGAEIEQGTSKNIYPQAIAEEASNSLTVSSATIVQEACRVNPLATHTCISTPVYVVYNIAHALNTRGRCGFVIRGGDHGQTGNCHIIGPNFAPVAGYYYVAIATLTINGHVYPSVYSPVLKAA